MAFINPKLKYWLFAMVCVALMTQHKSYAGGLPVRPGSLILSPSIGYFFANKEWDSLRVKKPFDQNGHFTSITYSLYAELGLSKRFSLVASLPYVISDYQQDNFKSHAQGLTDLETGLKYYLANINYIYYFNLQGTVITPLYTDLNLGYKETGAELKLSFSGSGSMLGTHFYFSVEDGIRQYFGSQGPIQDRYNGTFGISLSKKQQVALSIGGFYSASSFTSFTPIPASNKNFAFNQASISYGYSFTRRFSVFLNAGMFINGRNTGAGSSGSASLILRPF